MEHTNSVVVQRESRKERNITSMIGNFTAHFFVTTVYLRHVKGEFRVRILKGNIEATFDLEV